MGNLCVGAVKGPPHMKTRQVPWNRGGRGTYKTDSWEKKTRTCGRGVTNQVSYPISEIFFPPTRNEGDKLNGNLFVYS